MNSNPINDNEYPESYTAYNTRMTKAEMDISKHTDDIKELKDVTQKLTANVQETEKHINNVDKSLGQKFTRLETMMEMSQKSNTDQFNAISTKFDKLDSKFDSKLDTLFQHDFNSDTTSIENRTNITWSNKLIWLLISAIVGGTIAMFFNVLNK